MKFRRIFSHSCLIFSKIILISILPVTILTLTIVYSQKNSREKFENKINEIGSTQKLNYNHENALLEDINQKAHSDSVLFYYINWNAIFHKFGMLSHLIKILEENPNKEIYFFHRDSVKIDLSQIINNKEYKNFHYINFKKPFHFFDFNTVLSQEYFPVEMVKKVNDLTNIENKKIDFYVDDYLILNTIKCFMEEINKTSFYNVSGWNRVRNLFIKTFSILEKMNSVNLFADGTASMNFFSNILYEVFLFSGNKLESTNKYLSESINYSKIKNLNDLLLYLISFVVTNEKGNDIQKTKYFLPTLQMVNEANFTNSKLLSEKNKNDFFNPYNSLEADLISFCKTLTSKSKTLLNSVFSKEILNYDDFSFMDNNTNYVYSGRLLETPEICLSEASKLLEIRKKAEIANIQNYNIIFKGHPRDSDILNKLKKAIKILDGSDAQWLYTVNAKIPYEIYLINGILETNKGKNKVVKLFTTFSTINLFLYAEDSKLNIIENILINEKEKVEIEYYFTLESRIFPKEKFEIN